MVAIVTYGSPNINTSSAIRGETKHMITVTFANDGEVAMWVAVEVFGCRVDVAMQIAVFEISI
eukprot:11577028-Prorocentrum_lima.AAC.1